MSTATSDNRCLDSVDAVLAAVGQDLGTTGWITVTQERINTFAEATGDHQWIHVDPERARTGPFGACVAHGYLTLSLANLFLPELVSYRRLKLGVNYGCDKVRFPAPVKVGARLRGRGLVLAAEPVKGEGVQITVRISVEIEDADKPGCVVDTVSRLYFE
ncbi:MAG: dehydratase [Variovorax sp.]|nr:dehydratase [Variovorax sp.]